MRNSQSPCTLRDVSSLTEANLNISFQPVEATFNADNLQDKLLAILEKVQHVEKLTLGVKFLQVTFLDSFLHSSKRLTSVGYTNGLPIDL